MHIEPETWRSEADKIARAADDLLRISHASGVQLETLAPSLIGRSAQILAQINEQLRMQGRQLDADISELSQRIHHTVSVLTEQDQANATPYRPSDTPHSPTTSLTPTTEHAPPAASEPAQPASTPTSDVPAPSPSPAAPTTSDAMSQPVAPQPQTAEPAGQPTTAAAPGTDDALTPTQTHPSTEAPPTPAVSPSNETQPTPEVPSASPDGHSTALNQPNSTTTTADTQPTTAAAAATSSNDNTTPTAPMSPSVFPRLNAMSTEPQPATPIGPRPRTAGANEQEGSPTRRRRRRADDDRPDPTTDLPQAAPPSPFEAVLVPLSDPQEPPQPAPPSPFESDGQATPEAAEDLTDARPDREHTPQTSSFPRP